MSSCIDTDNEQKIRTHTQQTAINVQKYHSPSTKENIQWNKIVSAENSSTYSATKQSTYVFVNVWEKLK